MNPIPKGSLVINNENHRRPKKGYGVIISDESFDNYHEASSREGSSMKDHQTIANWYNHCFIIIGSHEHIQ